MPNSLIMISLSSSLERGVSVGTFFPFAMRQVGTWSLSSSVRLVKRKELVKPFGWQCLPPLLHRSLSSHLPSPTLHPHEHDHGTSSSCTPCSCLPSCTCPFSILLPFILLFRTFGYEMSNLTALIAWPLLVSSLLFVTKVPPKLVSTLDDSFEALDEHGNILIFIICTLFFTCG